MTSRRWSAPVIRVTLEVELRDPAEVEPPQHVAPQLADILFAVISSAVLYPYSVGYVRIFLPVNSPAIAPVSSTYAW